MYYYRLGGFFIEDIFYGYLGDMQNTQAELPRACSIFCLRDAISWYLLAMPIRLVEVSANRSRCAHVWHAEKIKLDEFVIIYNRQWRHSCIGNVPPALFAENFSKQPQAA